MRRTLILSAILSVGLAGGALAAGESHVEDFDFSFEGPFGTYDQNQLQRGFKVYTEICAACHGIKQVYFRNLGDEGGLGYSPEQIKTYAAEFEVFDPEEDDFRTAIPSDKFPDNSIEGAPDLSMMAKARAGFHGPYGTGISQFFNGIGGPEYIASILTGYTGEEKDQAGQTFFENTAYPGGWTAMPPPLTEDGLVEFDDGHANDIHHMAEDVSAFLMWTAEPKLMARKRAGFTAVIFLTVLAAMLYFTNKKLWAPIKRTSA